MRALQRDVAMFATELGLSPKGRRVLGVEVVVANSTARDSTSKYFDDG